ncbi:MAG TPA: hypothetical protein VHK91_10595 [Flavisolibacter sp.]|jgi:membrane-associated phospholipid phosphatase|nr:hypothetical protein [Flavisolibacter sp.]
MKTMPRIPLLLLTAALVILAGSFVLDHYLTLSDTLNGFLKGFAIGLLLLVLFLQKRKAARQQG